MKFQFEMFEIGWFTNLKFLLDIKTTTPDATSDRRQSDDAGDDRQSRRRGTVENRRGKQRKGKKIGEFQNLKTIFRSNPCG